MYELSYVVREGIILLTREIIVRELEKYVESTQVEKLVHRVKEVITTASQNNPNMYSKTKIKYREMAAELLDCVGLIAGMLEEELLDNSSDYVIDEFDELAVPNEEMEEHKKQTEDIKSKIKSIQEQVDHVDKETPVLKKDPNNKKAVANCGKVLSLLPNKKFETDEAKECATYLSRWWKARFNPDNKNPNFRYSIASIPECINSIIITYGKYVHDNKQTEFDKQFNKWIASVESDVKNVYSTPFFVHDLYKSHDPTNFTDEAISLYRQLYLRGLCRIGDTNDSRLDVNIYSVLDKVNSVREGDEDDEN